MPADGGRSGFSPFVCACFTLNYIVGTGFLALPWAFYQGGWLLSAAAMVCICVAANVGSDYVLSAMARAERIVGDCNSGGPSSSASFEEAEATGAEEGGITISLMNLAAHDETTPLVKAGTSASAPTAPAACEDADGKDASQNRLLGMGPPTTPVGGDLLLVGERMIDVPELCRIFLGDWGFKGYAFCVSAYLYGALWSFTSVFGNAAASLAAPSLASWQGDAYALSVLSFSVIVVPMSFLELSEQKLVQVVLSGGRLFTISLMIITPLFAAMHSGGTPHFGNQSSPTGVPPSDLSGVHRMMPIMVYAAIFHFSIPALAEEVTHKSQLGAVFGTTFVLCGSLYTCIGGINAWYFGDGVEQSANLNWGTYHGGTGRLVVGEDGEELKWVDIALWARAVSFFIVMFPAINVISAFPLHALSLGNSLMGIYYGENIHGVERNRRITTVFRAIACIPPLIGGLFCRDLGTITDFTGLAGLAIAFCFPALLYISSEREATRMGIPCCTHYERLGSSFSAAVAVLVFGSLSILGVFMSLVLIG